MKYQNALKELRQAMRNAAPLQLAIALEAVAYVHAATYLDHNPPPVAVTPAEREAPFPLRRLPTVQHRQGI